MKRLWILFVMAFLSALASATITGTTSTATFTCTGSTGPYPFTFPALDVGSLVVIEQSPTAAPGVMTILASSAWTGTPVNNSYANGGSITLVTACTAGYTLTIARATEPTQLTQFTPYMPALYASTGNGLDQLTMGRQDTYRVGQVKIGSVTGGTASVTNTPLGQYLNLAITGAGNGTVTNIATTSPITGGPITTTGTIGLSTVPITLGGTGATTAAGALANLGAAPTFTLTTTGTSGAATYAGNVINIPQYGSSSGTINTGTSGQRTQYVGTTTVGPTPNVFVATPGGSLQTEYNASQCFGQSNCLIDVPAGLYSGGTLTILSGMNLVCENWGAALTATTASADVIDVQAGATNWSIVGCTINGQSAGAPIVVNGNTYASPTANGTIQGNQIINSGGTAVSIAPGYVYYAANVKVKDNTFIACGSGCVGFSGVLGLDITGNYIYNFGTISASSDAFNAGGHFNQNVNISDNKAWVQSSTAFFMETGGGCSPGCGSAAVTAFTVSGSGGAGDTITFTLANAPAANFNPPPASFGVGWIEVYLSSGLPDVNWLDMLVTSVSSTQPWTVTVSYPNASQIFPASGSAAGIMMVSPVVSGFTVEKNQVYASGVSAATAFSGYFSHGNFIDNILVAQNAGQNATPSSSTYQACLSRSGLEIEGSDWGAIGNTIVNGEINVDGYSSGPIGVVVEGNKITDSCNVNSAWSAIGVSGDQGGNSGPNGPYPAKNIIVSSNEINLTGAGRSSGTGHGIEIGQDNGHNGSVDGFSVHGNVIRYGGGSVPNTRPIAFGGVNTSKVTGIGGTCATEPIVTLTDAAGVLLSGTSGCTVVTGGNCSVTGSVSFPIPYSFTGTAAAITQTWSGTALTNCSVTSGGTGYGTVIQNGSVTDNQIIGAKSTNFSDIKTGGVIGLAETATGSVFQNVTFDKTDCATSANIIGGSLDPCIQPAIISGSAAWTSNSVKDTNWNAAVTDTTMHLFGGVSVSSAGLITTPSGTVTQIANPTGTPSGTPTASVPNASVAASAYNYAQIVAVDVSGNPTLPGTISSAVTTTGSGSTIAWSWPAVPNAFGYQIWGCNTSSCTPSNYYASGTNSFKQMAPMSSGLSGTLPTANMTEQATFGVVTANGLTLPGTTSPVLLNGSAGTSGQVLTSGGAGATPTWGAGGGGSGTVTSVGLSMPGVLYNSTVPGSPVTSSGTLAPTLVTQTANTVLAGPTTGSSATPTFRALVTADMPSGTGTVTDGSGSTTANQLALATSTAHVQTYTTTLPTAAMPALTGDVTNTAGSLATTVGKVNGGAIPASAAVLASNGSNQIIAATTTGTGSAVLATSPTMATATNTGALSVGTTGVPGGQVNVLSTIGTTGTTGSINLPAGTTTADGVCWGTNCGYWDGVSFHFNGGIISQAVVFGTSFEPYNLSYLYGSFFPGSFTQPVEIIRNIGSGDTYTTLLVETPNTGSLAAQLDLQGSVGDLERFGSKPCETSFGTTTVNTGSATTTTGLTCLPANSVIDGVVYRITTTITTAASFTVGTAGSTSLFCGTQSTLTTGTTGVCMNQTGTTSELQGSAAAVVVTFNATPGAGAIRLVVRYHTLTAPTS